MVTLIEEPIEVSAIFGRRRIRPVAFVWRDRKYRISRIVGAHRQRKGQYIEVYYSVISEGPEIYELCFSTDSMGWSLVRIHSQG